MVKQLSLARPNILHYNFWIPENLRNSKYLYWKCSISNNSIGKPKNWEKNHAQFYLIKYRYVINDYWKVRTTWELVAVTYGNAAGAVATSGALYATGATEIMVGLALAHAMTINTTIAICEQTNTHKTPPNNKKISLQIYNNDSSVNYNWYTFTRKSR